MSFRGQLASFFVLIVVVPMISVAVVLFILLDRSEEGKIGAAVSARQVAAQGMVDDARLAARPAARTIARDAEVGAALRSGDTAALRARLDELRRSTGAMRILIVRDGRTLTDVGRSDAVWPTYSDLIDQRDRDFGRLQVSVTEAGMWVRRAQAVAGAQVILRRDGNVLASTVGDPPADFVAPVAHGNDAGTAILSGVEYRGTTFRPVDFKGATSLVTVLYEPVDQSDASTSRLLMLGVLAGFFVLACTFALYVSRSLQEKIANLLKAVRDVREGQYGARVPTRGRDDFAALGHEFNEMSDELERKIGELRHERSRVRAAQDRLGATFGSTLDREKLLDNLVRAAHEGLDADGGRATLRRGPRAPLEAVASAGGLGGLESAIHAAETSALESGHGSEVSVDDASAVAQPLLAEAGGITGVVAVARRGRPFTSEERDDLRNLAIQAAVSLENVTLHETAERLAVTDELTGLSNRRAFDVTLEGEVERARRFKQPLALVLLDLDDFKDVNDEHGHQVGDEVLRSVARVLRDSCREVDEPARYGGEELAVVMPNTDLDGAQHLAERIRHGVSGLRVPLPDGAGPLTITTSLGVATMPGSASDAASLVEAADDALYRAKRSGKNRTMLAA
jgi:diguanylate cyclase (GGDEF)-like protein